MTPHPLPAASHPGSRRPYLLLAAFSALAVAFLRMWPPQSVPWYPPCPFHQLTGLLCPGCGATRAFAALAAGHPAEALRLNPLAVTALAAMLLYIPIAYRATRRGRSLPAPSPALTACALAITVAFTLWRNLP